MWPASEPGLQGRLEWGTGVSTGLKVAGAYICVNPSEQVPGV